MKRILSLVLCGMLLLSCCGLSSCMQNGKSAYEIAVENGFQGDEKEWLASLQGKNATANNTIFNLNGEDYTPQELYEAAVENGYNGSFEDFLTIYFAEKNTKGGVARALLSAVCVSAGFTRTYRGFGYQTFIDEYSYFGSGVIYQLDKETGDAYIITNYHVIYDANSDAENGISTAIEVFLYGQAKEKGEGISATYVGGSMTYDIAILRVEDSAVLQSSAAMQAPFANSGKVVVGDVAIAVGNPSNGGISATRGIVSVDSEYIVMKAADGRSYVQFRVIRIDTAVNSGNSGGGLFSNDGEVIGIVNAKVSRSDIEGIAYAIPSNVAKYIADNLISNYESGADSMVLRRCALGITLETVESHAQYDAAEGATYIVETVAIEEITEGSSADGVLQKGDVLRAISINGERREILRRYEAMDLMLACRVGSTVNLEIVRNGETINATFTLTESDLVEVQ